jgi:hypothetical protein
MVLPRQPIGVVQTMVLNDNTTTLTAGPTTQVSITVTRRWKLTSMILGFSCLLWIRADKHF